MSIHHLKSFFNTLLVEIAGFDNAVLSGPCVLPKFGSGPETHILVCWRKPEKGFIALNADGASQNGIAAGGGILRDHTGKHIFNFYNNYGTGSVFIAESKAILDGLSICKELGYNKIQLQTDSRQATLCFGRRSKSSLSEQSIWDEIYKFQDELSIEILHVCREGNKMADYLSKKGILAKEMGTIDVSLDERAKELLAGEKLGISYLKKLKNQSAGVSENNLHTGYHFLLHFYIYSEPYIFILRISPHPHPLGSILTKKVSVILNCSIEVICQEQ